MANAKHDRYNRRVNYGYVDGNAARQLSTQHQRVIIEQPVNQPRRKQQNRSRKIKEVGIDFKAFIVLSFAIAITLYTCVQYLMEHSQVAEMERSISGLELQLNRTTESNNHKLDVINSKLDLDKVYEIAVGELGMVYPNNNNVINYNKGLKDIVIQYRDIPEDNSSIDNIINGFLASGD